MAKNDDFFSKSKCDRCGSDLQVRIMSWFNEDTICMDCSSKEDKIKSNIRANGLNPRSYEGRGYVPQIR